MSGVQFKGPNDPALALPLRCLNHVSRVTRDVQASAAFYRDVLGFIDVKRPSSFEFEGAWLYAYGLGIHLIRGQPVERSSTVNPKSDHLSFQTDDLEDVERRLAARGISCVKNDVVEDAVCITQLFFHDPDNNMIEICNCHLLPVEPLDARMADACRACDHSAPSHDADSYAGSSTSEQMTMDHMELGDHSQLGFGMFGAAPELGSGSSNGNGKLPQLHSGSNTAALRNQHHAAVPNLRRSCSASSLLRMPLNMAVA